MPAKKDLLLAMTGHASTNKWDIVCCYHEDIINNIFKEKYKQGKLVTDVKLKGSYQDPFMGEIMLEADLVLHEPELQFVAGTRNISQLTMPILSGSCTLTPKSDPSKAKSYTIDPNVLQVVGNIPLAAASGDTEEVHDGTCPIVFKDGTITTQQVFLHFKNVSETTFNIVPVPSKEEDAHKQVIYQENIRPEIIALITTFFKEEVSEIDYSMGGISNASKKGATTILPKSFIFSVSKPDNNSAGCLNLYIQSVDSGNPPGDVNPSFQPAGNTISPVPDGYTASLILSGDFMGKLLASLLSDKKAKFCSNTDGLLMQINIAKSISYPGYHHDANHWFKGINIDISNTPMYLNLKQDKMNVTLNSPSNSGGYANWDLCDGEMLGGSGKITVSFSVNETFDLKLTSDGMLQFNFTLNQSGVNVSADIHVSSGGWTIDEKPIIDGIKSSIPPAVGTISVSMNQVNVFVVSNLLFPDQNKLNFTGGDSFYMPHDLIVFGNIK